MTPRESVWPDRPLHAVSLLGVVGAHLAALWIAIVCSRVGNLPIKPAVLAVSFIRRADLVPPAPVPTAPSSPPEAVFKPRPEPIVVSQAQPEAQAVDVATETRAEADMPEPALAYPPLPPEPAGAPEAEPPRFDMAYLQNPSPAYPSMSKRLREEGAVALLVRVSVEGEALSVEVARSSGFSRLDDAARRAVRRWKFKPSRRGDEAVEGIALVPITFSLKNSG